MKTTILATATGKMNMGGYFSEKTAQVFTIDFPEINEKGIYFRFRFLGDSCDECFNTLEDAMSKFNKASELLN